MGTTANGLPYPEPTDPVAAGADAIKALAMEAGARRLMGARYSRNAAIAWPVGVMTTLVFDGVDTIHGYAPAAPSGTIGGIPPGIWIVDFRHQHTTEGAMQNLIQTSAPGYNLTYSGGGSSYTSAHLEVIAPAAWSIIVQIQAPQAGNVVQAILDLRKLSDLP